MKVLQTSALQQGAGIRRSYQTTEGLDAQKTTKNRRRRLTDFSVRGQMANRHPQAWEEHLSERGGGSRS